MRRIVTAGLVIAAMALTALAQDWYQDRTQRYQGDDWRPHIFDNVRTDLEHVWSVYNAKERERLRLDKTKEELYKMQTDLEQGRFDNGLLNDVIDSLRKSANDDRLATRDKEIVADDMVRLKDFQNNHDAWPHK